jgi:hypothetical protein
MICKPLEDRIKTTPSLLKQPLPRVFVPVPFGRCFISVRGWRQQLLHDNISGSLGGRRLYGPGFPSIISDSVVLHKTSYTSRHEKSSDTYSKSIAKHGSECHPVVHPFNSSRSDQLSMDRIHHIPKRLQQRLSPAPDAPYADLLDPIGIGDL